MLGMSVIVLFAFSLTFSTNHEAIGVKKLDNTLATASLAQTLNISVGLCDKRFFHCIFFITNTFLLISSTKG